MPPVFQSERFFREAWPQISQAFESPMDAASDVQWISGLAALEPGARGRAEAAELIGESEIRLYSAHELSAMLRPERWARVELYGGLDGTPFSLDAPRIVLVARK